MEDQHTAITLPPPTTISTKVAVVTQALVTVAQALVTAGPAPTLAQAQMDTTTPEAAMVVTAALALVKTTPVAVTEVIVALETTTAPETTITPHTAVVSKKPLMPLTCANPSSTPTNTTAPSKPKPRLWSHSRPCA